MGRAEKHCSVAACDRTCLAKGLCRMHYKRQQHHGTTERLTIAHAIKEGDVFGRLTVAGPLPRGKWRCRCGCGRESEVLTSNLASGHSQSCGCLKAEANATHGLSKTKEYRAWIAMRTRCTFSDAPYYKDYGGRGISVCERWDSFDLFLSDMGPRPGQSYSVERSDVNGNYEPSNCYWATAKTQSQNRRCTVFVTVDGHRMALAEAVEKSGLKYRTVHHRIFSSGWAPSDALTKPSRSRREDRP